MKELSNYSMRPDGVWEMHHDGSVWEWYPGRFIPGRALFEKFVPGYWEEREDEFTQWVREVRESYDTENLDKS